MLHIAITFDYELFLGKNYIPEENVLFEPTWKLANMLDEEHVKGTFFADVCSVFQHEIYGQKEYCTGFVEQIKELTQRQHDVQLHIHPNWLRSTYDGVWNITFNGYKIHEFGFDRDNEQSAFWIIKRGKQFLEENLHEVNPTYKCIAYRAGGFCIRPEKELIKALVDNGIIIDSSVALRQKSVVSIQDYDFTGAPNMLDWWFESKKGLFAPVEKNDGEMYEVSIGYGRNGIRKFWGIPMNELHVNGRHGVGTGITLPNYSPSKVQTHIMNIKRRLFSDGILSFDSRGYKVLMRDIEQLYRKNNCKNEEHFVSIICHPKLASDATVENTGVLFHTAGLTASRQ